MWSFCKFANDPDDGTQKKSSFHRKHKNVNPFCCLCLLARLLCVWWFWGGNLCCADEISDHPAVKIGYTIHPRSSFFKCYQQQQNLIFRIHRALLLLVFMLAKASQQSNFVLPSKFQMWFSVIIDETQKNYIFNVPFVVQVRAFVYQFHSGPLSYWISLHMFEFRSRWRGRKSFPPLTLTTLSHCNWQFNFDRRVLLVLLLMMMTQIALRQKGHKAIC